MRLRSTVFNSNNSIVIYIIMGANIEWNEIVKKEAHGINDFDLGEVQEIQDDVVVTQKGVLDKNKFYLPKNVVDRFDCHNVWFKITKEDAEVYRRE
jgi:hypothetical protein